MNTRATLTRAYGQAPKNAPTAPDLGEVDVWKGRRWLMWFCVVACLTLVVLA